MICKRAEILTYLRKAGDSLSTVDNALIDMLHPLVESVIHNYVQNDLNHQIYTEYLPSGAPHVEQEYPLSDYGKQGDRFVYQGAGQETLKLTNTPVSVTGLRVWEDTEGKFGQGESAFAAASELTLGSDFYLDTRDGVISQSGLLYRIGSWAQTPGSVKVQYYGGFTATQLVGRLGGALKLATLKQFKFEFQQAKAVSATSAGAAISEKIGKYEYQMSPEVASYVSGITGHDLRNDVKQLLQPYRSYKYL